MEKEIWHVLVASSDGGGFGPDGSGMLHDMLEDAGL